MKSNERKLTNIESHVLDKLSNRNAHILYLHIERGMTIGQIVTALSMYGNVAIKHSAVRTVVMHSLPNW